MKSNVFDLAERRGQRLSEIESLRRQLLATQRTAGQMARDVRDAIDKGDLAGARLVLQTMIVSGELAERLLTESR